MNENLICFPKSLMQNLIHFSNLDPPFLKSSNIKALVEPTQYALISLSESFCYQMLSRTFSYKQEFFSFFPFNPTIYIFLKVKGHPIRILWPDWYFLLLLAVF